jgi:hypothetical protein
VGQAVTGPMVTVNMLFNIAGVLMIVFRRKRLLNLWP